MSRRPAALRAPAGLSASHEGGQPADLQYERPDDDAPLDAVEQAFVKMFVRIMLRELEAEGAGVATESPVLERSPASNDGAATPVVVRRRLG